jgi:short subunit dehydrogenase-like uncharacterized protein
MIVDELQKRHQTKATSVDFYVLASKGAVSGGTVDSVFTMLDAPWSELKSRLKRVGQPYYLNPTEGAVTSPGTAVDGGDRRGMWLKNVPGVGWLVTCPFVMASINTRIVRRTNALLGYSYGSAFAYTEQMGRGGVAGVIQGFVTTFLIPIFFILAIFPFTRSLLQKVVPAPGEGPSKKARETGFFDIALVGVGENGARVTGRVKSQGDPGYKATARMLAETGLCLAAGEADARCLQGGILTPASAMGAALKERLVKQGMTFACDK